MLRHWPIAAVLIVQVGILAYLPADHISARASGTRITLLTAPVDPYDFLSGYYMVLTYEVERPTAAMRLPPGLDRGDRVWLTVERATPAWKLVSIDRGRPEPRANRVSLPARWQRSRAVIEGAGRLYIPESQRERADKLNREFAGRGLVDVAVGEDGTVAVLRLHLGEDTFGE